MRRLFLLTALLIAFTLTAAAQGDDDLSTAPQTNLHTTYHRADGNRFIAGTGTFPDVQTVDIALESSPVWLVGASFDPMNEGLAPLWAAVNADGDVQAAIQGADGALTASPPLTEALPPGTPPLLVIDDFGVSLDQIPPDDASLLTHPVRAGEFTIDEADGMLRSDRTVYIAENGDIVLLNRDNAEMVRLPLNALPDARIVISEGGLAAVYVAATDTRYVHGALGDDLEAAALIVLDLNSGVVPVIIELPGEQVFEGIAPLWADVTGDGVDDIVTTVSDGAEGARIHVYSAADGVLLASGPSTGEGESWRHQLAWGPFGPAGENELVEVLTPHTEGVAGFYRYNGAGGLELVAQAPGYTSHVFGSRNLDMAVAGDFNGDGQPEIVLPSQDRTRIVGLQRGDGDGGIVEAWTLPLDGELVTNLSAVTLPDGRLGLAAGVDGDDGPRMRLWLPR